MVLIALASSTTGHCFLSRRYRLVSALCAVRYAWVRESRSYCATPVLMSQTV